MRGLIILLLVAFYQSICAQSAIPRKCCNGGSEVECIEEIITVSKFYVVEWDGTQFTEIIGGDNADIVQNSTGNYTVNFASTPNQGSSYDIEYDVQVTGVDDINAYTTSGTKTASGFSFVIGEQDNGAAAGTPRNNAFRLEVEDCVTACIRYAGVEGEVSAQAINFKDSLANCQTVINQLVIHPPEVDGSVTNEIQTLSIAGNVISLSNGGGSVTIPNSTDTDDQTLTYDPNTKNLTIQDGNTVDIGVMPTWTTITAPTLAGLGTYTTNLSQVTETDTYWYVQQDGDCREVYEFHYRLRGTHAAGNGWGYVDVPNIAGWDRDIYDVGTYRQTGLISADDGVRGAMATNPYMGNEAHHWSNSGRIYLNQANFRDNDAVIWLEFTVQYKRN